MCGIRHFMVSDERFHKVDLEQLFTFKPLKKTGYEMDKFEFFETLF